MGGMDITLPNIFYFISSISPLLLSFFLVMASIFNQNLKGIVYLAGILLATVINTIVLYIIRNEKTIDAAPTCNLVNLPFNM